MLSKEAYSFDEFVFFVSRTKTVHRRGTSCAGVGELSRWGSVHLNRHKLHFCLVCKSWPLYRMMTAQAEPNRQLQDPEVYDCLRTSIACIFREDREDIPNFGYSAIEAGYGPESDEYASAQTIEVRDWFLERWIGLVTIARNDSGQCRPLLPWGECVAMGMGPRGFRHAVVWDAGWWLSPDYDSRSLGKMIHDPHISGKGLVTVDSFLCFVPLGHRAVNLLAGPGG